MDENNEELRPYIDYSGKVVLPHQCDEWYIGGKKDVEKMIVWLQELLKDPDLKND